MWLFGFGCDCVGVEHEAIGEGGLPYGSDFLPKSVVYGVGVGRAVFVVFLCYFSDPLVGEGWVVLLDRVEGFCGEDVEGGWDGGLFGLSFLLIWRHVHVRVPWAMLS